MSEVTQWFEATDHPVRVGIYERRYGLSARYPQYDYWDGRSWRYPEDGTSCLFQERQWRGLAHQPEDAA